MPSNALRDDDDEEGDSMLGREEGDGVELADRATSAAAAPTPAHESGLDWATARDRAALDGPNTLTPPVHCPPVICCLLPCLAALPSMRAFAAAVPEDALVLREGEWCDVEACDLVVGDVVLLQERETAPADLVVLSTSDDFEVGTRKINGSRATHRPGVGAAVALGTLGLGGHCRGEVVAIGANTRRAGVRLFVVVDVCAGRAIPRAGTSPSASATAAGPRAAKFS